MSYSVCYERSETAAGFSAEDLKRADDRSCDFTAHMCTGIIVHLDYTYYINILEDAYGC